MQRTQNFRPLSQTSFYNDANLVRYYTLDDLNGKGGTNNLTNNNSCTQTTGIFSGAYSSGTSNTNKSLTNTTNLGINGGACTISVWAKMNGNHQNNNIYNAIVGECSGSGSYVTNGILINQNNTQIHFGRLRNSIAWGSSTYTYSPGTIDWHHYVYTYDGTYIRGYVNGVLVAGPTAASGTGTVDATRPTGVTIFAGSSGYNTSAQVDDNAYFSRALSDAEVLDLYGQMTYNIGEIGGIQRTGPSPNVMAYYPLTGGDAKEYSYNGLALDGTNQGAVTYSSKGAYFNGSTYITVPDNNLLDTTTDIWISAEIIPTATNASGYIVSKGYEAINQNNYSLYYVATNSTNGYIEFRSLGASGRSHKSPVGSVPQDKLTKIDISCSAGLNQVPSIYINGAPVTATIDDANSTYYFVNNTNTLAIGAKSDGGGKFTGHIKHLRLRKRIPTAQEVRREYTNDKGLNIV